MCVCTCVHIKCSFIPCIGFCIHYHRQSKGGKAIILNLCQCVLSDCFRMSDLVGAHIVSYNLLTLYNPETKWSDKNLDLKIERNLSSVSEVEGGLFL